MADRIKNQHARTVRFEVLLTPGEAQRIQRESMRRGLTVSAYARMAVLGDVEQAEDMLNRAVERIGQVIRHDSESVVAAVAAAATIIIGQVSNRSVPAEERAKAVGTLTAYYRRHVAREDGGKHVE
jgi:hypothetical protein